MLFAHLNKSSNSMAVDPTEVGAEPFSTETVVIGHPLLVQFRRAVKDIPVDIPKLLPLR